MRPNSQSAQRALQRESSFFLVNQSWGKALSTILNFILPIRNHFRNRLWKAAISSIVNDPIEGQNMNYRL
jgi:hypothetical protein